MAKKPKDEAHERQQKGVRARRDAIQTLIANHQDEFDRLVAQNRVAAGLSPRASGPSLEALEERIQKFQAAQAAPGSQAAEVMKKALEDLQAEHRAGVAPNAGKIVRAVH